MDEYDHDPEKKAPYYQEKRNGSIIADEEDIFIGNADDLQRHLNNRQIQLIALGGAIGTALFVSIGGGLNKGGPAGLFLAYTIHSLFVAMVNNGTSLVVKVSSKFEKLTVPLSRPGGNEHPSARQWWFRPSSW